MRRFALRLTGGLLACALACSVYLRHRQIQVEREKPFGRFTQQQIIERTVPLCQTILGHSNGLLLATERCRVGATNGAPRLCWRLQCTDSAGRQLAEFVWDARTGELASVTHNAEFAASRANRSASAPPVPMPEAQARAKAAWLAYRWLRWLGIAREGSRWRLTREPERCARGSAIWYSYWQSAAQKAAVQVDVGSGVLVSAQSWPLTALSPVP